MGSLPPDRLVLIRNSVERMQDAEAGSCVLDRLVFAALAAEGGAGDETAGLPQWSSSLEAAAALVPRDYDFSMGRRDGVCWAWVQPDDGWQPDEFEARHDHPLGSGLVVARTPALALTCAALRLRVLERTETGPS